MSASDKFTPLAAKILSAAYGRDFNPIDAIFRCRVHVSDFVWPHQKPPPPPPPRTVAVRDEDGRDLIDPADLAG